jgi:hypothetical protein
MESRANFEAKSPNLVHDGTRAANAAGGPVESREKAIPRCLHFAAAEAVQLTTDDSMVLVQQR